jgi:hypothetical protein
MKIPKAVLVGELRGAGLTLSADKPDLLPYQHFLVFTKPALGGATHG